LWGQETGNVSLSEQINLSYGSTNCWHWKI
jgi:hypothetical protein